MYFDDSIFFEICFRRPLVFGPLHVNFEKFIKFCTSSTNPSISSAIHIYISSTLLILIKNMHLNAIRGAVQLYSLEVLLHFRLFTEESEKMLKLDDAHDGNAVRGLDLLDRRARARATKRKVSAQSNCKISKN